jgi:hypothetical protein
MSTFLLVLAMAIAFAAPAFAAVGKTSASHYAPTSRQYSDWDKSSARADASDPYWTPCEGARL